jgi:Na+/melibiose symporter-like transporter
MRNQVAIGADSMMFTIGMYFMPVTTVLSALAAGFTSDKTLIGAISLAWYVGWMAPQLWAARMMRGKPRMRPYALIPAALSRPIIFLLALWLWIDRGQSPLLSVWLLIIGVTVFTMADGVVATAGWDMIGRALSPRVRSRVLTVNSLLSAIGGLGAGFVVERVLANENLPFPLNYAVLLAIAAVFYMLALACMAMIQERPAGVEDGRQTTDDGRRTTDSGSPSSVVGRLSSSSRPSSSAEVSFLSHLLHSVRSDAVLRRTLLVRLFTGVENMAAAFYVVFAREQLLLPESAVGVFSIAIVAGGLIGIIVLGSAAMRFGSRRVIQAAGVMQFLAPTAALAVAVSGIVGPTTSYVLIIIMALNGAVARSNPLGYFSYTQDCAPEIDRPMYISAMTAMSGVASLLPLLGGSIIDGLQRSGTPLAAYPTVFALAAVSAGIGAVLSFGLPKPRRVDSR